MDYKCIMTQGILKNYKEILDVRCPIGDVTNARKSYII